MKKAVCALFALMLMLPMPCSALAEGCADGLAAAAPITGERLYPVGEDGAQYRLSYAYPQFEALTETDEGINEFYKALGEDAQLIDAPDEAAPIGEAAYTRLGYRVARNDDRYLSVVLSSLTMQGNAEVETISADTFARDGLYAGQPLSLTQVLGLEREDDALDSGRSLAESIALKLVWEIVAAASENADAGYPEGITEASLEAAFSPESDFYLDEDGNIVFFIQSGELAGEIAGVLYFPFAPAELLSAVR